jgi:hypothetical protein
MVATHVSNQWGSPVRVAQGGEAFLRESFGFDGAKVLDFELELAAPVDECGFGDVEFGG